MTTTTNQNIYLKKLAKAYRLAVFAGNQTYTSRSRLNHKDLQRLKKIGVDPDTQLRSGGIVSLRDQRKRQLDLEHASATIEQKIQSMIRGDLPLDKAQYDLLYQNLSTINADLFYNSTVDTVTTRKLLTQKQLIYIKMGKVLLGQDFFDNLESPNLPQFLCLNAGLYLSARMQAHYVSQ